MGLKQILSSIFKRNDENTDSSANIQPYKILNLRGYGNGYPLCDTKGNKIHNILRFNISGTTYQHIGKSPSRVIPKLNIADDLLLIPNPENTHDPEAVRVMTLDGNQIGWVPKDHPRKHQIFSRLMDGYEVFSCVANRGTSRSGTPWCEIQVVLYATPTEPSLEESNSNSLSSFMLKLKEMKQQ